MKTIGVVVCAMAIGVTGCERRQDFSSFDLVVVTNRLSYVYEINKTNGDLTLISGSKSTPVKAASEPDETPTPVTEWTMPVPLQYGTNSMSVTARLKHKWQDGSMKYIFTISPYAGFLSQQVSSWGSETFLIALYDTDGFHQETITVNLASSNLINESGSLVLEENSSLMCSKENYQSFKLWSVSWTGFVPPIPPLTYEQQKAADDAWVKSAVDEAFHPSK